LSALGTGEPVAMVRHGCTFTAFAPSTMAEYVAKGTGASSTRSRGAASECATQQDLLMDHAFLTAARCRFHAPKRHQREHMRAFTIVTFLAVSFTCVDTSCTKGLPVGALRPLNQHHAPAERVGVSHQAEPRRRAHTVAPELTAGQPSSDKTIEPAITTWAEPLEGHSSLILVHEHDVIGDWVTLVDEQGTELCLFDADACEALDDGHIAEVCGWVDVETRDSTVAPDGSAG
jgi:hypothetical protein